MLDPLSRRAARYFWRAKVPPLILVLPAITMTDTPSSLPSARRTQALPNILAVLTYDDGPYDRDGDWWRLGAAAVTTFLFAMILDSEQLTPAARTFLLVVFGPELFRRIWVTLPQT
jgi:hypothetical protein